MMTKAIVIKTYGDEQMADAMAGAIIDATTKRIIRLDEDELATVKAEVVRLRDKTELRAYGDNKRLKLAQQEMARKYTVKPAGRLAGVLWGLYGLMLVMWEGVTRW